MKHLIKLRPLLLLMALFMLTNCQEELDVITKDPEQKTTLKKHTLLYGKDALEKRDKLISNLKKEGGRGLNNLRKSMGGGVHAKTLIGDIEGLIDYSEVYQVDQGNGVVHYTYMLNHPDTSEGKFFNIVLKTYGSLEKVIMIGYSMEEQFIADYALLGDFTKFTGTVNFELITIDTGFPCDEEPNIPIGVGGGSGSGGGGAGSGGTQPAPGSGGSTHGGNPYNQAIVDAKFQAMAISAIIDDSEDGEEDEDDEDDEDDDGWIWVHKSPRYFRVGYGLTNPANPCDEDEETGIIEPDHKKNCDELKKMSTDATFQANMADLTAKAAVQNFESAYTMYQNSLNGLTFSGEATGTSAAPEVSLNMSQSQTQVPLNCIGFMHCHLDSGGTFSIFSFSDIIALATVATASTRGTSELSVFLTTANGTFALKVSDRIALKNNLQRMEAGSHYYEKDFAEEIDVNMPHDQQVLGFLKFVEKKFADTGLGASLYEQDANGDWEQLTLSSNKKQINRKKC